MSVGTPSGSTPLRLAIVDYGMGNRRSVQKALEHLGATATITADVAQLEAVDGLVLPGVGAFPRAVQNLQDLGLIEPLRALARQGKPLLGICLGMQLLFERSEEGHPTDGLALLAGEVTWLSSPGLRIPHIGWSEVRFERRAALTEGLPAGGCAFYHVHSLAVRPVDEQHVVGTTEYGERFATIVQDRNTAGVQFHPEKSSGHGLALLASFLRMCKLASRQPSGLARA